MPDLIRPTPPDADETPRRLSARLGWFAAIAVASAVVVALAAYALKALLPAP
jgi:hypothetical protein